MKRRKTILLPGLDGTGKLFAPLIDELPQDLEPQIVIYPNAPIDSYDELVVLVQRVIPQDRPFILVAESFSGPLAIKIAATHPQNLEALILCATFVAPPVPLPLRWLRLLIHPVFFHLPLPHFLIRYFALGTDCPRRLVEQLSDVVRSVKPEVIASRIKLVMTANEKQALRLCRVPILYLAARRDRLVRRRAGNVILTMNPRVKKVEIDAPHLLFQCEPKKAIVAIVQFLQDESPE